MRWQSCRWAVVPAAGAGTRFGGSIAKQYQDLGGRSVIDQTLSRLFEFAPDLTVVVVLAKDDRDWCRQEYAADSRVKLCCGGAERADSVLAGLRLLAEDAKDDDWVLVHDAARPCVKPVDIAALLRTIQESPIGGLLACPVVDTIKHSDDQGAVQSTLDRSRLYTAQTPQMFRFRLLLDSLQLALQAGALVTDESSALEYCGYQPLLQPGSRSNIKITSKEDLMLAEMVVAAQSGVNA